MSKHIWIATAAGLVLGVAVSQASAQDMSQRTELEAALTQAAAVVEAAVTDGRIPGAQMVVAVNGEVMLDRAFGFAQLNDFEMRRLAAPRPVQTSTVFDLASVTKVMATTLAMMKLVDENKADVDEPVYSYLPDFRGPELDKITIRHLLTHTGGLVQWQPLYYGAATKAETYRVIRDMPLQWPVGEGYHYSDLGFMLLGYIVERVAGKSLDAYLSETFYGPLGLRRTTFLPKAHGLTEFAVTESGNGYERHMVYAPDFGYDFAGDPASWDGWRQYVLDGEVNDGNAWHANAGVAGHAGLFSTAGELKVLLDLLLNHGSYEGQRYIRQETVDLFLKPDAHLGWRQPPDMPPGSFAHTGFTGTYVLGVPEVKLAFVLLTNRQNVGADPRGHFTNVDPIREGAVQPLLQALMPEMSPSK